MGRAVRAAPEKESRAGYFAILTSLWLVREAFKIEKKKCKIFNTLGFDEPQASPRKKCENFTFFFSILKASLRL